MDKTKITVFVNNELLKSVNDVVKKENYGHRSELVRELLRARIKEGSK